MNSVYGTFGQGEAGPVPEKMAQTVTYPPQMDAFPDWFHAEGIEKKMEENHQEQVCKQAARLRATIVRTASKVNRTTAWMIVHLNLIDIDEEAKIKVMTEILNLFPGRVGRVEQGNFVPYTLERWIVSKPRLLILCYPVERIQGEISRLLNQDYPTEFKDIGQ